MAVQVPSGDLQLLQLLPISCFIGPKHPLELGFGQQLGASPYMFLKARPMAPEFIAGKAGHTGKSHFCSIGYWNLGCFYCCPVSISTLMLLHVYPNVSPRRSRWSYLVYNSFFELHSFEPVRSLTPSDCLVQELSTQFAWQLQQWGRGCWVSCSIQWSLLHLWG